MLNLIGLTSPQSSIIKPPARAGGFKRASDVGDRHGGLADGALDENGVLWPRFRLGVREALEFEWLVVERFLRLKEEIARERGLHLLVAHDKERAAVRGAGLGVLCPGVARRVSTQRWQKESEHSSVCLGRRSLYLVLQQRQICAEISRRAGVESACTSSWLMATRGFSSKPAARNWVLAAPEPAGC